MKKILKIIMVCVALFLLVRPAYAAIKVKLFAVNPSDVNTQKLPVKYYFPEDIKKEDVLDPGGMEIDFDVAAGRYYAYKEIELPPKGTQTLQIIIQDKWSIPPEQINVLKNKLHEKLKAMEGMKEYDTAKLLASYIENKMDNIIKSQNEAVSDVERKIALKRINEQALEQLENDILSLEYLASKEGQLKEARSIKFIIEANNPTDKELETTVTNLLPKGVEPEYVIGNAGFDIDYDSNQKQYLLTKKEKLLPRETRKYEIEIKDMWFFPGALLDTYKEEGEGYKKMLVESRYKNLANMINDEIKKDIEQISHSQATVTALKDRIALYQENSQRDIKIRKNIERLKSLLAEIVKRQEFFTVLKEKNPLAQLKIADIQKKKAVPKVEIWKIVLYLVIFLTIFTLVATVYWIKRMGKAEVMKFAKIKKPKVQEEEPK